MNSGTGTARRFPLPFVAIGLLLLILCMALVGATVLRGRLGSLSLPASEGLPTAVPVPAQPIPTDPAALVPTSPPPQPELQPTVPPQPQPPAPQPQPTAPPAPVVVPSGVEPIPAGGDQDAAAAASTTVQGGEIPGGVEPFAVGSGSNPAESGSGSGNVSSNRSPTTRSTRSNLRCGVRVYHTVRPGENLFRIGLRYNTTAAAIARRNGIPNVRLVRAGQRLTIVTCR